MKSTKQLIGESNKKLIAVACCLRCREMIHIYEMAIIGGVNKGKIERFHIGCKCEDMEIAKFIRERNKKLKIEKQKKVLQDTFQNYSFINKELQTKTLQDYKPQNEKQSNALMKVKKYMDEYPNNPEMKNILFCGPSGVGKSHLAKVITDAVMEKGDTAIFITVPTLLRKIRSSYDKESQETEQHIFDVLEKVDLLVLDDIGTGKNTSWSSEKLFDLINTRRGMHTIYTTNIKENDLETVLGSRISSRIVNKQDTEVVEIIAKNYRTKNN